MTSTATMPEIAGGNDLIGLVVAAHDGSPGANLALRWAAHLASDVDARLRVVRIWQVRDVWDEAVRESASAHSPSPDRLAAIARRHLAADVAAVPVRPSKVELHIARGPDEAGLILQAVADADLLVLGSRGRGRATAALLGSVAARCTREAPCPVVVVPRRLISADHHLAGRSDREHPKSLVGARFPSPTDGGSART